MTSTAPTHRSAALGEPPALLLDGITKIYRSKAGKVDALRDSTNSRQILTLLRQATDQAGQTVVMVTHDPVAAAYAEQVLFLSDGLVAGSLGRGTPQQIATAMSELER
jgi:ABC-type lipoprotein export system ATPase subunit